jgi:2-aminoethylphosphonate dioxygenase
VCTSFCDAAYTLGIVMIPAPHMSGFVQTCQLTLSRASWREQILSYGRLMTDIKKARSGELDNDAIEHYLKHGWVTSKGFFSTDETSKLIQFTDEVVALPERAGAQMVYGEQSLVDRDLRLIQRVENFCPYHAGFDEIVRRGRLREAIELLFGGPALLFKDKINLKLPGGAGFEPHQDQQAGWSAYAPLFLTALVCIDAATVANGCIQFAKSKRQTGLIGSEWQPLNGSALEALQFESIPTHPGDVVFFDSYVPHRSAANLTDQPRRLLYLTYNLASQRDQRSRYYSAKRANFPPDVERVTGVEYRYRV